LFVLIDTREALKSLVENEDERMRARKSFVDRIGRNFSNLFSKKLRARKGERGEGEELRVKLFVFRLRYQRKFAVRKASM
jgi:hypothetical protein